MSVIKDITGQRSGRLTAVVRLKEQSKNGSYMWLCKCDCGEETIVSTKHFGATQSCGCLRISIDEVNARYRKEGTVLTLLTQKISRNNTSKVKGVSWQKSKRMWCAQLSIKGMRVLDKCFSDKQDAINARKEAEEKYFKPILEKYGKSNTSEVIE